MTTTTTSEVTTTTTETTTELADTTTTAVTDDVIYGDANCDGNVSVSDAVSILQYLANATDFPLSEKGKNNADVYARGDGITGQDASTIQKYDAGVVTTLPESYR